MKEIQITLTVDAAEVDTILGALGEQPFIKVVDLIQKIRTQALPQWQEAQKVEDKVVN